MSAPPSRLRSLLPWVAVALVILAAARVAWVCDDAYITFRSIDHWQLGYGPVWNPAERVQAYTHPLWMLLLAGVSSISGELYFTAIGTGLVLSTIALSALIRIPGAHALWPALLALGASKAWTEFATSGLENSLSYALIACSAASLSRATMGPRGILGTALLLGLAPLCRPDLALIALPAALVVVLAAASHRRLLLGTLLAGLLPGLAWTTFATIYYGSPLPNTALAKLGHAETSQAVGQGLAYFSSSLQLDPALLPVTCVGLAVALASLRQRPGLAALALGSLAYLGYVLSIGGDFMSGRFLTVPLLVAVAGLMCTPDPAPSALRKRLAWGVGTGAVLLSLTSAAGPLRTGSDFHVPDWDDSGIADERGWYYPHLGLVPILREGRDPPKPGRERRRGEGKVRMGKAIGMDGYMAGPHVHLVDAYALCDPLLARIPSDEELGRPGHWIRPVPHGYLETLKTGQNQLVDPEVRALWEDVYLATRAPLRAPGRAAAILRLATAGRTSPIVGVPPMQRPPRSEVHEQR